MRALFIALCALAASMLGHADRAEACWREAILGNTDWECRAAQSKKAKAPRVVARSNYDDEAPQRRRASTPRAESATGGGRGNLYGVASYYWQPQPVASGGRFNPNAMTAAHKTLPFGTRVRVTHLGNGRSVQVVINDRGPYIAGRIIDLSRAAAGVIGMQGQGIAQVRVEVL